jgi:hypothetical protein
MTSGNYGGSEESAPPSQPQYGPAPQPGSAPQYAPPSAPGEPHHQYGGQAGFGQPYGYGTPRVGRPAVGTVGIVLAVVGAVAGIIAFTATNWYDGSGRSHFSNLHDAVNQLDRLHAAAGLASIYYGWLAWTLLAVGTVAAMLANLPSPASAALRVVGALVGVAGVVFTFLAIRLISKGAVASSAGAPNSYSEYLKHAAKAPSLYLAAGGFLLITIGALIGPRRR